MVEILTYIFLFGYTLSLIYVTLFCLLQLQLLFYFLKKNKSSCPSEWSGQEWPHVTVQLPVFNEKYVVERLVDAVVNLDYPKDRLEIQLLDDSTDDTLLLSRKKVEQYQKLNYDIKLRLREDRKGFKAGALKEATPEAKGEFIAIFDADFIPQTDFLKRAMPCFNDEAVGVVQTRWDHLNQDYSLLTELQAFQLNVHFTVEQKGREKADLLLQFNGTAGIWRKTCIESAGGWEADTLTEDLDLSYRAQLKGWKIKYLLDVLSPAELPAEIHGLKSQQYRWMKGGAETAKKLIPEVWSSGLSLTKKFHATFHLLASSVFVFVFFLGVFSVPVLFLFSAGQTVDMSLYSWFLVGLLSLVFVYYVANVQTAWKDHSKWKRLGKFIFIFPLFLAMSMGLSLHNSIAVLQGYRGRKSDFVRTPKYGQSLGASIKKAVYLDSKISGITIFEGLLCVFFLAAGGIGISTGVYSFVLFHLLLSFGYGAVFYYSLKHLALK